MILVIAAVGYIAYVALTQPELLTAGLFKNERTAPTVAQADDDLPEDSAPPDAAAESDTDTDEETQSNPYSVFDYYIADKQADYEMYQEENPSLSADEVVWMVNAGLHLALFTDAEITTEANPLLINPRNRLPDDFVPVSLEAIDDNGRLATPETISAFRKMQEGAVNDGFDLTVQSAYRTMDYQRGLYERAGGDGSVARPTFSEHHTGRALDLWGPDGLLDEKAPSETGQWVAAHAHEYGFIVRYTEENRHITGYISEPWHIVYVGEQIAGDIVGNNYSSLEEYVAKNPEAKLP